MNQNSIRRSTFAALFTVLIIIGAYIALPLPGTPVPIVLQNMFILLAGIILGPVLGFVSVAAYLLLGALGLPVFAGGKGGFVHFFGPTGGFLFSYLLAVVMAGVIANRGETFSWIKDGLGFICGSVCVYAIGVSWLKFNLNLTWFKALSAGCFPFLLGAVIKAIAAVVLSFWLRPIVSELLKKD